MFRDALCNKQTSVRNLLATRERPLRLLCVEAALLVFQRAPPLVGPLHAPPFDSFTALLVERARECLRIAALTIRCSGELGDT